jgi:hypothetical protein
MLTLWLPLLLLWSQRLPQFDLIAVGIVNPREHSTFLRKRTNEVVLLSSSGIQKCGGGLMKTPHRTSASFYLRIPSVSLLFISMILPLAAHAGNDVLGEVELVGASKIEKTSGVWIDGQYLGYLKELKGSKKILLLPGEHNITVRQDGYVDFVQKVSVRPGEKQTLQVKMERDPRLQMPRQTAEIKLDVVPNRAAVFVDGLFVGHAAEFNGIGRGLLVTLGKRRITISLPGYQTFETDIQLAANQKSAIRTQLVKGGPVGVNSVPE